MKWIKAQWRETLAHLDLPLLLIVCVLSGIGLASIYSATASDGFWKLDRQIINMLGAAAVMLTVARTPPQTMMRYAVPLYVAAYQLGASRKLKGISWATNAKPNFYDAWLAP